MDMTRRLRMLGVEVKLVGTKLLHRRQRGVGLLSLGERIVDVQIRQGLKPPLAFEIVNEPGEKPDIKLLEEHKAAMKRDGNRVISLRFNRHERSGQEPELWKDGIGP